jgi:uncharacterized protein
VPQWSEDGGTKASSAYELALALVESDYPPDAWNIYPFHFSDGDNWHTDNERCLALVQALLKRSNQLGYGEIRQGGRSFGSTLMTAFDQVKDPKFRSVIVKEKADVYPALRTFFAGGE